MIYSKSLVMTFTLSYKNPDVNQKSALHPDYYTKIFYFVLFKIQFWLYYSLANYVAHSLGPLLLTASAGISEH